MPGVVLIIDPNGVVRETTDDMRLALAKVARLAAPSLASGTPRWWEAGWRITTEDGP